MAHQTRGGELENRNYTLILLSRDVASTFGLKEDQAKAIMQFAFDTMLQHVAEGDDVQIWHIGTFARHYTPARMFFDPHISKIGRTTGKFRCVFRVSPYARNYLNEAPASELAELSAQEEEEARQQ